MTCSIPSNAADGDAIRNTGVMGDINQDFQDKDILEENAFGGAIYNATGAIIKSITGEFTNNSARSESSLNTSSACGGAIYNAGEITEGIINSSFYNNYVSSSLVGSVFGGAIYTESDLKITADNYNSVFSGNFTQKQVVQKIITLFM